MTTVAWDGKTLAGDGRITSGSLICSETEVKVRFLKGKIQGEQTIAIGWAGSCEDAYYLMTCLQQDKAEEIPELDMNALVITKKNVYRFDGKFFYPKKNKFEVIGTGSAIALTALTLGLTAKEAVKHACKLDCNTGGKITTLHVR